VSGECPEEKSVQDLSAGASSVETGEPDERGPSGRRLRVLVVDDTEDFRVLMRVVLERTGDFEVVAEAQDGEQGLEMASVVAPDVVLLDIAMPVMDGLQALPQIRGLCPDAAVVMLSGFGASKMRMQAVALGADGYLEKGQPMRGLLNGLYRVVADLGLRGQASAS
jgi:DNA-binding NarL/FixJ family response regulator